MKEGVKNLTDFLKIYDKLIISTHESPDPDGLGAEIGFKEILNNLNKEAIIINSDPTPEKYSFMDIDNEINVIDENFTLPKDLNKYAIFVLDTNELSNIGTAYTVLWKHIKDTFIIDHHEGGEDKFHENYIKADASSACEIVCSIFKEFNFKPSFKAAQALYTGILFDTGSFRYPKTTPDTFHCIAGLVKCGANPFNIYEHVYENNSLSSFELRAMMLGSMEVLFDGRMVLLKLTPEMLKKSGAIFAEGEPNITIPLTVLGVQASVLVKQDINGPIKVSMRTKGDLDVAQIAIANGGGGHKNAAGFKSKKSFDETCKRAVKDMEHFFR